MSLALSCVSAAARKTGNVMQGKPFLYFCMQKAATSFPRGISCATTCCSGLMRVTSAFARNG